MGCCESSPAGMVKQSEDAVDVSQQVSLTTCGKPLVPRGGRVCPGRCGCNGAAGASSPMARSSSSGSFLPEPTAAVAQPPPPMPAPGSLLRTSSRSAGMVFSRQAAKTELTRLQFREVTPEDYELLCLLDEENPKKAKTMSEASFLALPRVKASESEARVCQVCLEGIEENTLLVRLPCQHIAFHLCCIKKWLMEYSSTCPLCQAAIEEPEGSPSSVEGVMEGLRDCCGATASSSDEEAFCGSSV